MLPNAVAWVGEEVGGGGALHMMLHMLCKISLLPLLVFTFACNFFKLKRASRHPPGPRSMPKPSKSHPRESKKQGPKQNTKTSRFMSSPWCQNAQFWRQFYQKSPKGAPKAPKRLAKATKKHPKRHPQTTPKPNRNLRPLFINLGGFGMDLGVLFWT